MVHKKEANKKKIIVSETNLVLQFSPASNSGGSTCTNQGNLFFHLQTSGDLLWIISQHKWGASYRMVQKLGSSLLETIIWKIYKNS